MHAVIKWFRHIQITRGAPIDLTRFSLGQHRGVFCIGLLEVRTDRRSPATTASPSPDGARDQDSHRQLGMAGQPARRLRLNRRSKPGSPPWPEIRPVDSVCDQGGPDTVNRLIVFCGLENCVQEVSHCRGLHQGHASSSKSIGSVRLRRAISSTAWMCSSFSTPCSCRDRSINMPTLFPNNSSALTAGPNCPAS